MVTIGLFRTVSEINGDFSRKSPFFPFLRTLRPIEIGYRRRGQKKTRMMGLPEDCKSFKTGLTV